MCNGFTGMGIFMENLCHYRDCKSSSLCCYRICKRGIQFHTYLDPDCYRICMLLGCFYCASTYSSTSALILIFSYVVHNFGHTDKFITDKKHTRPIHYNACIQRESIRLEYILLEIQYAVCKPIYP
jgi:hypothetical protein